MSHIVCHIDDIPEGGARGFTVAGTQVFGVRKNGQIYLYLNRCPHLGINLDWEPDGFLDNEGLYIRCANHGAFFETDTGTCIMGPCLGDALWSLAFSIDDGFILVSPEELPESPRSG